MIGSLVFSKSHSLVRYIRREGYVDNGETYCSLRTLRCDLKDKDDEYLRGVVSALALNLGDKRLKKFIKHNTENFSLSRFVKFCSFLDENKCKRVMYLTEYHELLKGVDTKEAESLVYNLKNAKVTSKKGFIARHGEDIGGLMFKEFQRTSSLSYEIKKESGFDTRLISHWCKDHWIAKGYSEKEAELAVSEAQFKYAGINPTIWRSKGYSESEVDTIMAEIDSKKGSAYSFDKLRLKLSHLSEDEVLSILENRKTNMVNTLIEKELAAPKEYYDKFKSYSHRVRVLTEQSKLHLVDNIHLRSLNYHLDHRYSILRGFLDNVPAEVLSSHHNLEVISATDNLSKASGCSIELSELLSKACIVYHNKSTVTQSTIIQSNVN